MDAEDRARLSLPEGMFDTLPDIVKQTMIMKEQEAIIRERYLIWHQKELEELERYREEERERVKGGKK